LYSMSFIFRVPYKSFIVEMCLKHGTISWLALVFFGLEQIELLVKYVVFVYIRFELSDWILFGN
jgi:hypothetical protein